MVDNDEEGLTEHERGVVEEIVAAWSGKFPHSYKMPARRGPVAVRWIDWQIAHQLSTSEWSCENLRGAAQQYAWDNSKDADKEDNYFNCRSKLIEALKIKHVNGTRDACVQIFKWGGVAKREKDPSRRWVEYAVRKNTIVVELQRAISILKGAIDPSSEFGRGNLLMNSAMTKVYSLGDPEHKLPIYDGRVGAALGLFVIQYCRKQRITNIPDEVDFGFFDSQIVTRKNSRNPSRGPYIFRRLGDNQKHAKNMWRCFRILNVSAGRIGCSVLDIERALFMIGYDVTAFK